MSRPAANLCSKAGLFPGLETPQQHRPSSLPLGQLSRMEAETQFRTAVT
jgi:hypothetical protein